MGTTVEELKKLYTKLGGKDKQVATFNQPGEILNAINEIDLPTDYELPKVTTTDAGKVLTVSDAGKWDAETPVEPEPELPAVTSEDEGKVLTVDSEGAWGAETPTKELPAVTAEDEGKVLTVDSEGAWGAVTPIIPNNVVLIPGCLTRSGGTVYGCPVKVKDIVDYVRSGKIVYLYISSGTTMPNSPEGTNIYIIDYASSIGSTTYINGHNVYNDGTNITFNYFHYTVATTEAAAKDFYFDKVTKQIS